MRLPMFFLSGLGVALAIGWLALPRVLYRSLEQPIQFSHQLHTGEQVGFTCDGCHQSADDGHFMGLPASETCEMCHAEAIGETDDERRLVEEFLATGREVPWHVYARQPENVYFSHDVHLHLAEIPCETCHGSHGVSSALRPFEQNRLSSYSRDVDGRRFITVGYGIPDRMKMGDCAGCHRQRGVREGCLTCHK